ncbi:MAG: RiPP maturation radical SAM C-methyltransferase [Kiritimatiellae bacterium]|nr:RiPP maturation radical SAM C-methyltransferase [Kiritimatiellia bacterium]
MVCGHVTKAISYNNNIAMPDVMLVSMPYAVIEHPSLAIGLLKVQLERKGISVSAFNAFIYFAREIGLNGYYFFSNCSNTDLLGEWTFAEAAFPEFKPDSAAYLKTLNFPIEEAKIWEARRKATLFIDQILGRVLDSHPKIIGCSSTFQQQCSSLALMRRIREEAPEIITVMGGANCEGSMGRVTHESFDWVDYVVAGEADETFPALCSQLLEKGRDIDRKDLPPGVLGPCDRKSGSPRNPERPLLPDMNSSVIPDFSEYFADLRASGMDRYVRPGLLIETSRGCWWGQKQHCTFCGLNGEGMRFRVKTPERARSEMALLSKQYGINRIMAVDSILDMKYFDTLLPMMAADSNNRYLLAFETKANLKRKQVRMLAAAGIRWIQPGIESLHPDVLKLLKKGTTVCLNIELMKWAREFGVYVIWNFLVKMPGDRDEWYAEIAGWLPLISHLGPPSGASLTALRYDRFSSYFQNPHEYGIELKPLRQYSSVFPLPPEKMADFVYYFEDATGKSGRTRSDARMPGLDKINEVLTKWRDLFYKKASDTLWASFQTNLVVLNMREEAGAVFIHDTRPIGMPTDTVLKDLAAVVYQACDTSKTPDILVRHLQSNGYPAIEWKTVKPVLDDLVERKLMLSIDGRYLGLAVHENKNTYLPFDEFPGGYLLLAKTKTDQETPDPDDQTLEDAYGIILGETNG